MLKTIIKKGTYQDSVVLMLLTNEISSMDGVNKVNIMMGTPANKDIFKSSGLHTEEMEEATANDMVIVVDTDNEDVIPGVLDEIDEFITEQSKGSSSEGSKEIRNWETALEELEDANMALISVPGVYAASVADRALDEGLNAFIFSDNVDLENEKRLKEKADEKGLLVMGPDSGTGILNGIPIAFANNVSKGNIGIVGASGTGIQEVTTILDRMGSGAINAIGTGGRDLRESVGGITMLKSIAALNEDDRVKVIVVISKPPAESVKNKIMNYLRTMDKPVVTIFMGEKPDHHEEGLYHAYTLEEAARIAIALAGGDKVPAMVNEAKLENETGVIKAYYSGGTLGEEAGMLIKDTVGPAREKIDGYIYNNDGFEVMDLGDDRYTQGKPHPMIDPEIRIEYIRKSLEDERTKVILFDVVLGYGSHDSMAEALRPGLLEVKESAEKMGRKIYFVASITGTDKDRQVYEKQKEILLDTGVEVFETNAKAVERALAILGKEVKYLDKDVLAKEKVTEEIKVDLSDGVRDLLLGEPKIINIGLKSFSDNIKEFTKDVVQFNWKPVAGGDLELIKVLDFLREYKF